MSKNNKALIRLLDDPSPIVQNAVRKELRSLNEKGIELLNEVANDESSRVAKYAKKYLKEIFGDIYIQKFLNFINSLNYELETGFLILDQSVYPGVEVNKVCSFLDEVANRCSQLFLESASVKEKLKVINRVLFHEYSFAPDNDNFFNPQNSFLHQVIERRRGIPITLTTIYILIAQRCGLKLDPVRIAGRVMVGCYLTERPFYIDPFEKGFFRFEDDIHEVLSKQAMNADYIGPIAIGDLLSQNCRNLVQQYAASKDEARSIVFKRFVDAFEHVTEKVS